MKPRVLFVDDEVSVLKGLEKMLFRQRRVWDMVFAADGEAALAKIEAASFDVVVTDMRMPGMDGIQLLDRVRKKDPNAVRMMLTGNTDLNTAIQAVNQGNVFRFLTKPCEADLLRQMIEAGVRQHQLVTAEKELLNKTLSGSVKLLTEILTLMDSGTFSRSLRLRDATRAVCRELQVPNGWEVMLAAMLGEIGYITLPPDLAAKSGAGAGKLSPQEKDVMERLPEVSSQLVRHIPRLQGVARIIMYRNKNFDGSGFPNDSVHGNDIPLGARIIKILSDAEDFAARGQTPVKIRQNMKDLSGRYDPAIVEPVLSFFAPPAVERVGKEGGKAADVALDRLRIGHKLMANVETLTGEVVAAKGNIISPAMLSKIKTARQLYGLREPIQVERVKEAEGEEAEGEEAPRPADREERVYRAELG